MKKHGLAYTTELCGTALFATCWLATGLVLFAVAGVLCLALLALEGIA